MGKVEEEIVPNEYCSPTVVTILCRIKYSCTNDPVIMHINAFVP